MFEKGKKCGLGKITYNDGSIYEGDFKNNLRHGEAYFTSIQGQKIKTL